MKYFVITRFNLLLWSHDKNGESTWNASWLHSRFELFETYCLPSIMVQTDKDFVWYCLLDNTTPEFFRNKIIAYQEICPQLVSIYLTWEESSNWLFYVKKEILRHSYKGERIVTTRLDNDDSLHRDFIRRMKQILKDETETKVYSFSCGIQYFPSYNLAIKIPYRNNHFLTLIEKREELRTIYAISHFYIDKCPFPFILFDKKIPMWIEVIHDRNVDNDVKMTLRLMPVLNRTYLQRFGVPLFLQGDLKTLLVYVFKFFPRFIQQVIRRGKNKLKKI